MAQSSLEIRLIPSLKQEIMFLEHSVISEIKVREDGSEIGGSGVHFPSTPVKHLDDLRSRANRPTVFQHI